MNDIEAMIRASSDLALFEDDDDIRETAEHWYRACKKHLGASMRIIIRDPETPDYEWSWVHGTKTINMQPIYSGEMPYHREVLSFTEVPSLEDVIARIRSWAKEQG